MRRGARQRWADAAELSAGYLGADEAVAADQAGGGTVDNIRFVGAGE